MDAYVGTQIAARRSALGLSQGALGRRLGVTFQQVQKYESGTNRVSAGRLHAIATELGVSIADFFPRIAADPAFTEDMAGHALRLMTTTTDGRLIAEMFPAIADPALRGALARIVGALAART